MKFVSWWLGLVIGLGATVAWAADTSSSTVQGVADAVLSRLAAASAEVRAGAQSTTGMVHQLTPREREVLSTAAVRFRVDRPVVVTLFRDARQPDEPFWLESCGFRPAGLRVSVGTNAFEGWEKGFAAGDVKLGVNSLRGGALHYFVAVRARDAGKPVSIEALSPRQFKVATCAMGVKPYVDRDDKLTIVPEALAGQTLIRTEHARRDQGRLLNQLRRTEFPSSARPDHVVLTWSADPRTTQAIQWRTRWPLTNGWVEFWQDRSAVGLAGTVTNRVGARVKQLVDKRLIGDREVAWHTADLAELEPGTRYGYRVGDGSENGWTAPATFVTAPAGTEPFSFVYMGDPQTGFPEWGALLRRSHGRHPDSAFVLMAGDLVNRGAERDDWDAFFHHGQGVFDRRPVVPVIGNHDCQGGHPTLYLKQFALPHNGPAGLEAERAYAFEYGPALVVVLDSTIDPKKQAVWLEQQLADTRARWKFVAFHHPAYSSAPRRDNRTLRRTWAPIFEKHGVDLVLQGHDHAYLRTYPMRGEGRIAGPGEGPTYVVSVSGSKMYEQAKRDYAVARFTKVSTYQVIEIQGAGRRMVYRAWDAHGRVRDEFTLKK